MIYDDKYLKATLSMLFTEINNLSWWSAYNKDKYNYQIYGLKKLLGDISKEVYGQENVKDK